MRHCVSLLVRSRAGVAAIQRPTRAAETRRLQRPAASLIFDHLRATLSPFASLLPTSAVAVGNNATERHQATRPEKTNRLRCTGRRSPAREPARIFIARGSRVCPLAFSRRTNAARMHAYGACGQAHARYAPAHAPCAMERDVVVPATENRARRVGGG